MRVEAAGKVQRLAEWAVSGAPGPSFHVEEGMALPRTSERFSGRPLGCCTAAQFGLSSLRAGARDGASENLPHGFSLVHEAALPRASPGQHAASRLRLSPEH